jgi:hypothetical protein
MEEPMMLQSQPSHQILLICQMRQESSIAVWVEGGPESQV